MDIKYKVGDRVDFENAEGKSGQSCLVVDVSRTPGTITVKLPPESGGWTDFASYGTGWFWNIDYSSVTCVYPDNSTSQSPKPKNMISETIISPLAESLLDADTAALVKAGYLTTELNLTTKGSNALNASLFAAHKKDLIEKAKAELKTTEKA